MCPFKSRDWLNYFQRNASNNLSLADADSYELSAVERERISDSIRAFQLGEASEGDNLKVRAAALAKKEEDPAFLAAIKLFIHEENRHSGYLRVFMKEHGISRANQQWSDGVFRKLRRLAGLETSVRVLVTAEMIAMVYYPCLGEATGSPKLARICERMEEEERLHVRFQMGTLARIATRNVFFTKVLADLAHLGLMTLTTVVVWKDHAPVLRIRYPRFGDFRRAAMQVLREGLAMRDEGLGARAPDSLPGFPNGGVA